MEKWQRKEYENWDEAFRGQVPQVRQQAVRVADYTRELFLFAQKASFCYDMPAGVQQIKGQNADLAYKCGLYHQIGKALVPPEYQLYVSDFTDEEMAVFRKYTTDSRSLIETLQSKLDRSKERRFGVLKLGKEKNIPTEMMCICSEEHMERWNGSGFPRGLKGNEINPIAQIVAIAKELDRLVSERRSEHPFEEAIETLNNQSDELWNSKLIDILNKAKDNCYRIYEKYIQYTLTVPETISLVDKREGRPLGLTYRPMVSESFGNVSGYEAIPFFGGLEIPGDTDTVTEVAEILRRAEMIDEVTTYLFYEACDCLIRLTKCGIAGKGIIFDTIPGFYRGDARVKFFNTILEDQPIDKSLMILTVPESVYLTGTKAERESVAKLQRNGFITMLDDVHVSEWNIEKLTEFGITHIRFADGIDLEKDREFILECIAYGITVIGIADTPDMVDGMLKVGATLVGGSATGTMSTESEIVHDGLLRVARESNLV